MTKPGRYKIADTLLIGSDTTIRCAPGVTFVKSDEGKKFSHILLNRGALTRTYDKNITFENVNVLHNGNRPFLEVVTPVDSVTLINCDLNQTNLAFVPWSTDMLGPMAVTMLGCRFRATGDYTLFRGGITGKRVMVKTAQSQWFSPGFHARFDGPCDWKAESDLPGLKK